jgi:hypothetical protein
MKKHKRLWNAYCFPGYKPQPIVRGVFGNPHALVIKLERRGKKQCAVSAGQCTVPIMTVRDAQSGTSPVEINVSTLRLSSGASYAGTATA